MRNRLALVAAAVGAVAGMVAWLGPSSDEAAGAASFASPGQRLESGVVRHVVDRPGVGSAFVSDREGSDELSVTIDGETSTAPTSGEVTNPAISDAGKVAWAEDQSSIKVWDPRTDELTTLNRPEGTTAVFSPAFVDDETVASVGQEPVPGVPGEDDGLNNLFEVDLGAGTWEPVTEFTATLNDWSAVRTPVATPEGEVLFVRVRGASSATAPPGFELWTTAGEGARRLQTLPGEMYLAGYRGETLMWNAPSESCDDWGLYQETPAGLEQVGCGAVLADPLDAVDPDLEHEEHADFAAPPAHEGGELGLIVGDFDSRSEAVAAEARLEAFPGQRVVGHEGLPQAVAPGAWVILRPVEPGTGAERALAELRSEAPEFAAMAFIAPLDS
ncbi:MAG: hypothetical protein ACRDJL_10270 [Actinomycetota bacterium]